MPVRPSGIATAGRTETKQPADSSRAQHLAESAQPHANDGDFEKAIAEFSEAIQLNPDEAGFWILRAMAELADGQLDAYRRHCAEMLRYFGKKEKTAHRACKDVCRACTLVPDAVSDWPAALALAGRAVKMCPEEPAYMITRGAVLYRAGRWEEALGPLKEGHHLLQDNQWPYCRIEDACGCAYLAMAHYRLGHREEARTWFDKMVRQTESAMEGQWTGKVSFYWNDRVEIKLLRPEAARLLGISETPSPAKHQPEKPNQQKR